MTPRVTVGIAFNDEERYLAAAVRSVLGQSFRDFELLLVDDGSRDRSLEIARSFLADRRVRVTSDGRRRRLASRLNEIAHRARGELVARMDADDVMHPDKLALQIAHLDREPACHAVGTWAALVGEDERPFAVVEASPTPAEPSRLLARGTIAHATMLARAAWLRDHPYDERLARAEDRDLWCRVARRSRVDALEDVLYVIRVLPRGPTFLVDYLRGQLDLGRVVLRYGPSLVGARRTARLLGGALAKSVAMSVAHGLGASERLVARRGRPPTPPEVERVREALAAARTAR